MHYEYSEPNQVQSQPSPSRGELGLTTLEWLLIVAAVAGLAALAVVLVQNVVDETAEEISGSNARTTAAQVAAARITSDARDELPSNAANYSGTNWQDRKAEQEDVDKDYRPKCDRLEITYSDADIETLWHPSKLAASATVKGSTREDEKSAPDGDLSNTTGKYALCEVNDI